MPNIHEDINGNSYYYVLHKPRKSKNTMHTNATRIINKKKYKKHIKNIIKPPPTPNIENIYRKY